VGGGRFDLQRGQTTWGTQMAIVLANQLRASRSYDVVEVAKAYVEWQPNAIDLPETIKQALELIADHQHPEFTGYRVWLDNGQKPKDNSPLVRTAPIGVFFSKNREARFRATVEDVHITHFAPQVTLACCTFNGVIATAISHGGDRLTNAEIAKAAETELSYAASELGKRDTNWAQMVRDSADWLREDLRSAQASDPELYGPDLHLFSPNPTWVRVAFRLAFWELFHAPDLQTGLLDIVNRGGDADTNAAIAGALMGAVYGERAIPAEWQELVLESLGHMAGILWDAYHPRFLMNLASIRPGDPPSNED
jgi:ADP-ribosylglycohydrolase